MSNVNTSSYNEYYENDYQTSIEKAILAEDVTFSTIDNVQGKFFLPVMMPNEDISAGIKENNNGKYSTSNYIILTIPGYMLFQFMLPSISQIQTDGSSINALTFNSTSFTIPKGTTFLVEFLGGYFTIQTTCIVGLLTTDLTI